MRKVIYFFKKYMLCREYERISRHEKSELALTTTKSFKSKGTFTQDTRHNVFGDVIYLHQVMDT